MILISELSKKISEIPLDPGVYIFKNLKGQIIYIGKAKNLRYRIRSYFSNSKQSQKTQHLVLKIQTIDWIIVYNEVEALLLENKLVKKYKPKYNINLKDAKTYAYIAISKGRYPRIFMTRKLSTKWVSFGPYTEGYLRRELQRLVIKIFKIRTCKKIPKKACLNFHIGLCTAPCIGNVTEKNYNIQVERACSFLLGNYKKEIEQLDLQMKRASKEQKYEQALELRNQIQSIQILTKHQVVDTQCRYDQDVIAFKQSKEKMLVVHMGIRKGVLLGKKEFKLDFEPNIKQSFLKEFYYSNSIPKEILLNTNTWNNSKEKKALEKYFSRLKGDQVNLLIPKKGDKLQLINLAEKNIEVNMEKNKILKDLQKALNLPLIPKIIECFDISNLGKEYLVSGMVRFKNAYHDKKNYRRFKIKTVTKQDDVASIKEVVNRRYKRLIKEKAQLPDLIVIDGGIGQVNAAQSVIKSLGLQIPIIGLAKKNEEIFLPNQLTTIRFNKNKSIMLFLRKIRDAAHDYSLRYSRKRRQMKSRIQFKS